MELTSREDKAGATDDKLKSYMACRNQASGGKETGSCDRVPGLPDRGDRGMMAARASRSYTPSGPSTRRPSLPVLRQRALLDVRDVRECNGCTAAARTAHSPRPTWERVLQHPARDFADFWRHRYIFLWKSIQCAIPLS